MQRDVLQGLLILGYNYGLVTVNNNGKKRASKVKNVQKYVQKWHQFFV